MTRTVLAVVGLLVTSAVPGAAQVLFGEAPASRSVDSDAGLGVVRSRPVRVRLGRIPGASAREATLGVLPPRGHLLVLNLFPGVVVRARMTRSERAGRALVWAGRIEGRPLGDVVLAIVDGVMSGSAVWPGGAYRIRYDGSTHVVEELDHGLFPEDGCFEEVPGGAADVTTEPIVNADDGSLIDVLVVYTPAARAAAGGTPAIQALINTAVAETNTGYANSGVIQRLRLAAAQEIGYAESGTTTTDMSTDLSRVTGTADGYMDSVHALRDAYHADLVSLIVTGYNNYYGACGIAWLMAGNNPAFGPNAFSVIDRTCATGYYSFGHELGHNMGLNHARTDPVGTGAYPYSYGYKDPGNAFRTVMAYNCPVNCTRILHFSNPNVLFGGNPTGIAEASPSSAYNALSLNNTRVTVANWRASSTAAIRVDAPNGGQSWRSGTTHTIAWTGTDLPADAVVYITYSNGNRWYMTNGRPGGLIAAVPASQGSYSWTVPLNPSTSWRVELCVPMPPPLVRGATSGRGDSCLARDSSDAPFSITP